MNHIRQRQLWFAASLLTLLGLASLVALSRLLRVPAPALPQRRYVLHAPTPQNWNHDESWKLAPSERPDSTLATAEIPSEWSARYSAATRARELRHRGADPEIAKAAEKAWQWLRQTQSSDGSWGSGNRSGLTALALLGGLGQGDMPCQPDSPLAAVSPSSRALSFLLQQLQSPTSPLLQARDHMSRRMDSALAQSLCAYALAECLRSSPNCAHAFPQLSAACRSMSELLLPGQNDTSPPAALLRWDLQALRCIEHHATELGVSPLTLRSSIVQIETELRDIEQQAVIDLGPFGGQRSRDPAQRELARNPFFLSYFQAQIPQATPAQWQQWHQHLASQLLPQQLENGSWSADSESPWHSVPNLHSAHANTCLALLMLQSLYRYTDPNF